MPCSPMKPIITLAPSAITGWSASHIWARIENDSLAAWLGHTCTGTASRSRAATRPAATVSKS
ncbi:hypothetical protein SALBM217S_05113 [Streptomyces griseoloalbus]